MINNHFQSVLDTIRLKFADDKTKAATAVSKANKFTAGLPAFVKKQLETVNLRLQLAEMKLQEELSTLQIQPSTIFEAELQLREAQERLEEQVNIARGAVVNLIAESAISNSEGSFISHWGTLTALDAGDYKRLSVTEAHVRAVENAQLRLDSLKAPQNSYAVATLSRQIDELKGKKALYENIEVQIAAGFNADGEPKAEA